jgi:hypothetical protein
MFKTIACGAPRSIELLNYLSWSKKGCVSGKVCDSRAPTEGLPPEREQRLIVEVGIVVTKLHQPHIGVSPERGHSAGPFGRTLHDLEKSIPIGGAGSEGLRRRTWILNAQTLSRFNLDLNFSREISGSLR